MSTERVEKFHADAQQLLLLKNSTKLINEIKKLSTWLQKHQSDAIPDNHKQQLLTTIELYYNFFLNNKGDESLHDVVFKLADDYLKLPEGKLVHSKGKKKILKWMDVLTVATNTDNDHNASPDRAANGVLLEKSDDEYDIINFNDKNRTISISNPATPENVIDDLKIVPRSLYSQVKEDFENGLSVSVTISDNSNSDIIQNNINHDNILNLPLPRLIKIIIRQYDDNEQVIDEKIHIMQ